MNDNNLLFNVERLNQSVKVEGKKEYVKQFFDSDSLIYGSSLFGCLYHHDVNDSSCNSW